MALSDKVLAIVHVKLPPKLKNVGSFTIQFIIIGKKFSGALSNLGVSINLMLYLVYETLDHGDFKETNVAIQLENCTNRYPKFLVEDVLVQVNELIFLC